MPRKRREEAPLTPLARRIDAAAATAGLTNEAIAAALGVTAGNVSHWRIGRHEPSVEMLLRLAEVLGTSGYTLLTGAPDPGDLGRRLAAARALFREEVQGGTPPVEAWEQVLGQPGLLEPEERAVLAGAEEDLRQYFATADGREWFPVGEQERRVLGDLLRLFARRRGERSPGGGPGSEPALGETSG